MIFQESTHIDPSKDENHRRTTFEFTRGFRIRRAVLSRTGQRTIPQTDTAIIGRVHSPDCQRTDQKLFLHLHQRPGNGMSTVNIWCDLLLGEKLRRKISEHQKRDIQRPSADPTGIDHFDWWRRHHFDAWNDTADLFMRLYRDDWLTLDIGAPSPNEFLRLLVPNSAKEDAERLGVFWDPATRSNWAKKTEDMSPFEPWVATPLEKYARFYIRERCHLY